MMFTFQHAARHLGPRYKTRFYGSPLEPWVEDRVDELSHQSWFVGGPAGALGALYIEGQLYLALGPDGMGLCVDSDGAHPLVFDAGVPEFLIPEPKDLETTIHGRLRDRRAPLKGLKYHRVDPKPGQRFLLSVGIDIRALELNLDMTLLEMIDAGTPSPETPSFFQRVFSKPPEVSGSILALDLEEEPVVSGFAPWLRALEAEGVHFSWMGTEGGEEAQIFSLEPSVSPQEGILNLLNSPAIQDHIEPELWKEFSEGREPEPDYKPLDKDALHKGWWREADWEEVMADLNGRAAFYSGRGQADARLEWERIVSGAEFCARMKHELIEPVLLALHEVPEDESVVVWFALGGVSKTSKTLEVVVVQRVWT